MEGDVEVHEVVAVGAPVGVAEMGDAVPLGHLFKDVILSARRTRFRHGTVPGDELAVRVVAAAEEEAAPS